MDGLALAIAFFQKTQVVFNVFVGGVFAPGGHQSCVRALIVAAQHVRVSLVVEDLDRRPKDADSLRVGAVGKIKSAQAIIGCRKTEPRLGIAWMLLDGAPEMFFGEAVVIMTKVLLAETEFIVRVAAEQTRPRYRLHAERRRYRTGGFIAGLLRLGGGGSRLRESSDGGFAPNRSERLLGVEHPASQRPAAVTINPRAIPLSMPTPCGVAR